MHRKFAQRIASVVRSKTKAAGPEGAAAWWREVFPRVTADQVKQVKGYLNQLGSTPKGPAA